MVSAIDITTVVLKHSLCNPTHGTKSCCSVLINKVKTVNCNTPNKGKTDKSQIADYVLDKKKQNKAKQIGK